MNAEGRELALEQTGEFRTLADIDTVVFTQAAKRRRSICATSAAFIGVADTRRVLSRTTRGAMRVGSG